MEQEDSNKGTESPPKISSNPQSLGKDDSKKMEPEASNKGTESPPKMASNPQSLDKDDSKKNTDPREGSSKPELSDKNTPQSLKAKSKIRKKSKAGKLKTITNNGHDSKKDTDRLEGSSKPELSDKNTPQSLKAKSKIVKKSKAGKRKALTNNGSQLIHGRKINKNNKVLGNADELPKEKSLDAEKSKEKESQNLSTGDNTPIEKRHQAKKNKTVELGKSEQKQKNKEQNRELYKGTGSRTNKGKRSGMENTGSNEKKREKLGGFIFMCNAKTKPDCFRHRVMGVSLAKKDVVLGLKPGMKLFLYDFDLKLLYGIYKATSSGGMKLEPRAFGGNFPVQVRFCVTSDCFPLPESIFKKAIKENYDERHKFKTELTIRQVRKLTELFRPVEIRSALQPSNSPPRAIIRDREAPDDVWGSRSHSDRDRAARDPYTNSKDPHSHRERAARDPYTNRNLNSYNVLSHEWDPRTERHDEIPRDLFLTEKSYRTYGLQGDRRIVPSASQMIPIPEPYERDYEREHLHHLDPIYRTNAPAHVESRRADPLHLNESDHQTYVRGAIPDHIEDSYRSYRYGASPRDPYLPSREEISTGSYLVGGRTLIGTDNLQRREPVQERLYSTYSAADALAEYNRMQHGQHYPGERLEATSVPVSSRYSFAGPSYSLR
ncbi:hypothetical protein RIF29_29706 [Crotalaria pallida]|uniref:DCD domain-containing protein n=1 Tax=Crotalaria pallida TaxID=3830 RepID=A0AAN9EH58_CROPI